MRFGVAIGVTAIALVGAGPSTASQRYAAPNGTGPPATCPQANPCNLIDAVEGPAAVDGDEVLLAQGTYVLPENLDVIDDVTISPVDPAGGKPVLTAAAGTSDVVDVRGAPGALLSDLEIRATSADQSGIGLSSGAAQRLAVSSVGAGACLVFSAPVLSPVVLRDSTCVDSAGGPGLSVLSDEPSDIASIALAGVTGVSSGSGALLPRPFGLYVAATDTSATASVTADNVIATGSGANADIRAEVTGGATSASVDLESSNFDLVSQSGASVTAPGSGTNQMAPPLFADLATGNAHQATGSPTINAGASGFLYFGDLDVDRDPRTIGPAPDIGGDEFVPDTTAPDTELTKQPKKKVKSKKKRKKAKFAFSSTEPGSTFTCSLDGGPAKTCDAGTFVKKVKRGKHTFEVAATDAAGNTDATPAEYRWKLKRKR